MEMERVQRQALFAVLVPAICVHTKQAECQTCAHIFREAKLFGSASWRIALPMQDDRNNVINNAGLRVRLRP